jgi:hypothetical protein
MFRRTAQAGRLVGAVTFRTKPASISLMVIHRRFFTLENWTGTTSNPPTMKTTLLLALVGIACAFCVIAADAPAKATNLRHVVAFKFKDGTATEKIKEVEDAFRALKGKIPEIVAYEWGTNISPEKHDKGFTHGFILTFKSEKDRDAYLVHPDHKKFGALVGPVLGDVFVIDFWAKD